MNLDRMLRDASQRLRASVDSDRAPDLTPRRRSSGFIAALAGASIVIVVGLVVLVPLTDGEDRPSATETTLANPSTTTPSSTTSTTNTSTTATTITPATGPLFGEATDEVLVFDNGLEAFIALDPDNRLISTVPVYGQRAGDQPYRIHRVGDHLVVGWGIIHAYSLATGESTRIDYGTLFLPAVEPDRVWIVDWANGGNIGTGTPSAWQVDMEGNVLTEPAQIDGDVHPSTGIPGGLALETEHGIRLWYPEEGVTDTPIGMSGAIVLDAWGDLLAYCDNWECGHLQVVDLASGTVVAEWLWSEPSKPVIPTRLARFSPDGSTLAFALSLNDILYLDVATGAATGVGAEVASQEELVYVAWSPDSRALYAATYTYATRPLIVMRHDLDTLAMESVVLPFGGTLDFVVIDRSDAAQLLVDTADL